MPRTKKTAVKKTVQKAEKPAVKKRVSRRGANLKSNPGRPSVAEMREAEQTGYFKAIAPEAINNVAAATWTAFLQRLAETGMVGQACKDVGLNRITAYARRRQDEEFRELWEQAHQDGMSVLEDEAKRRAYEGVVKGVYYKGDRVDEEVVYSDQLLMFLMQGRDTRYKRKQEITGADGGALLMLAKLDDDGLDDLIAAKMKELGETPDA